MELFKSVEPRPCMVSMSSRRTGIQEPVKALFYLFMTEAYIVPPSPLKGGHAGGQVCASVAIVEFEDGSIHKVEPTRVRFLDTEHVMGQYAWGNRTEEENA